MSRSSPSLNILTDAGSTPWQILASTILSLRTRDEVTLASSRRLFALAPDPAATRALTEEALAQAIFPAGFYRTKARQLVAIARLLEPRSDQVPSNRADLLELPGVGRKTANLVLNLAFGIEAICVDTHVHRIPNRLGWIATRTPKNPRLPSNPSGPGTTGSKPTGSSSPSVRPSARRQAPVAQSVHLHHTVNEGE